MILLPQPLPPPPQQLPMTTQLLQGQIRRPPPPVVRQDAEVLSGPTTSTVMMKTITPVATGTEGHAVTTTSKYFFPVFLFKKIEALLGATFK